MRKIIVFAVLVCAVVAFAQTQLEPSVTDNGGGCRYSGSYSLLASIGQSVAGVREDGTILEAGFVTAELLCDTTGIDEYGWKSPVKPTIGEFFPNPFNSATQVRVGLPSGGELSMSVYDITGKQIYSWETTKKEGIYTVTFNAAEGLPGGIYLYKISAVGSLKTGKFTFVK